MFQKQLAAFIPLITSAAKAKSFRNDIKDARNKAAQHGRHGGLLTNNAINISFSQKGLNAVRVSYTSVSIPVLVHGVSS